MGQDNSVYLTMKTRINFMLHPLTHLRENFFHSLERRMLQTFYEEERSVTQNWFQIKTQDMKGSVVTTSGSICTLLISVLSCL